MAPSNCSADRDPKRQPRASASPDRVQSRAVDLWQNFLEDIRTAREQLGSPATLWYRGHSHEAWSLLPSLYRARGWPERERRAFEAFERAATRLFDKRRSDWEILFDMQHYGIPTRLLDWSEALGVAVAFVMHTPLSPTTDAAIYVLDPLALNHLSGIEEIKALPSDLTFEYKKIYWYKQPFSPQMPIATSPPLQSVRLFAQRGVFTIHGAQQAGLERLCPNVVKKVVLPAGARSAAMQFLEDANLDEYTIYPDIVGMARLLRRQIFEVGT